MRRLRNVKIVATLGPASSDYKMIRALFEAGADVFRLNMSHGSHAEQAARHAIIRQVEADTGRPIAILADLQGPKLRVGTFANPAGEDLAEGADFRMDLSSAAGDATRVQLPHPEIFAALEPGATLLVNDGKIRLRVKDCGKDFANCTVEVGGTISNRKGVNVPDVVLPLAALSAKDKDDLEFACELGVDWLALSFVQRPEDVAEARRLMGGHGALMAKIEKPAALERLELVHCELEPGAAGTMLYPTGLAAPAMALLSVLKAGDEVLVSDNSYDPSRAIALHALRDYGIAARFFDPLDLAGGNPSQDLLDGLGF